MALVIVFVGICDMFVISINIQKFEVSEVSGSSYCNSKVNSETETKATNLIFIW